MGFGTRSLLLSGAQGPACVDAVLQVVRYMACVQAIKGGKEGRHLQGAEIPGASLQGAGVTYCLGEK